MDKSSQYPIEAVRPQKPDNFEHSIFPYASDANIKTLKQIHEQTNNSVHENEQVTKMLNGFAIAQTSPNHQEHAPPDKKTNHTHQEKSASKVCEIVFATHYNPTGHRTADGSEYSNSPYTARLQGVAVDKHEPVLNARLHTNACPEDEHDENSKSGKKTGGKTSFGVFFSNARGDWYVELRRYREGKKVRKSKGGFLTPEEAVEYMNEWTKTGVLDEVWD